MIVMGFDFGERRIGVSIGNHLTRESKSLTTVVCRDGPDWDAIDHVIGEWQPGELVVGLPMNIDGTFSETTNAASAFMQQLRERYQLPVHGMNERLSSVAARETLRQARQSGHMKRRVHKKDIDAASAQLILQNWLEQNTS